jgi:Secretion system C-terminal sorting domain
VHTYGCPANMSWAIKNSEGTIVVTGGPYTGGAPEGYCGGTYANTILTQTATLPSASDCYTVELMDSNGYGWRNYGAYADDNPVAAGLEIISNNTTVFSKLYVGNFGSLITYENALRVGVLNNEEPVVTFSIYPNPTTSSIIIGTQTQFNISIYDILGKLVLSSENNLPNSEIDLSKFQKGVYIAKVTEGSKSYLKKIILQ